MERFILKKLLEWKDSLYRKPLILKRCATGRKNLDPERVR